MRRILLAVALLLALSAPNIARADLAAEIKKLVPQASAMQQGDFEALAMSSPAPSADRLEDKSLTLMLLCMKGGERTAEQQEELRFLSSEPVSPSVIVAEICRVAFRVRGVTILRAPVTFLQADRITEVTAEQKGDIAAGHVAFKCPDLYEGKVQYIAQREGDAWRINEWKMPAHGIHLVRDAKGLWTEK